MKKSAKEKKPHQHFIPKVYLKKFACNSQKKVYRVYAYDKFRKEIVPNVNVANICVDTDLYTLTHLPDDQKYLIENHFSKNIESKYHSVYRLLVQEKREVITHQERTNILYTILSMYFRTPKILNQFSVFVAKFIEDALASNEINTIEFLGHNIDVKEKSFSEIRKEIRESHRINYLKTQLTLMSQFIEFRKSDGLMVIELFGDQEYITSDNPVEIRGANGRNFDLFDETSLIHVPLDSKNALFIAPKREDASLDKVHYSRDNSGHHIRLNESVFKNAERWIIGSKQGVTQFLIDHEEYTKSADENHPFVLRMSRKLELLNTLFELTAKAKLGDNSELVEFAEALRKDSLFEEDIDIRDNYCLLKQNGLI